MESKQPPQRNPESEGTARGARAQWLLAIALLIGIAFDRLIVDGFLQAPNHTIYTLCYGGFWMLYLALFTALARDRMRKNREAWFFAAASVLLVARGLLYAQHELLLMNALVLPLILMLHALLVRHGCERGQEGRLIAGYLAGWFAWPFSALGRCASAVGTLFQKRGSKTANQAILGVLLAFPALVVAGYLLLSADAVFSRLMADLFERLDLFEIFWHILAVFVAAMLFYSFLYNAAIVSGERPKAEEKERPTLPSVTLNVALSLVLALYAVFAYIQFTYLTGLNGLPAGLTYSQYARSGFGQLLWVCAINLGLFALCLKVGKSSGTLTALLFGLLAASAVMLGSALIRLLLYADAYGLTVARLFSLWLIAFLAFTLIACAVKLIRGSVPLIRILAAALMLWYLTLNLVNVDGIIAESVLGRAAREGALSQQDANYVQHVLSSDANAVRAKYRELLKAAADGDI
ncbi:MAG: DUF4173 domain-containing protein [Bacillota bacterium]